MSRPITLFTGQWADMPIVVLAEKAAAWGFDGLELACWGDHFEVDRAVADPAYVRDVRALLDEHGLGCWAISNHLVGHMLAGFPPVTPEVVDGGYADFAERWTPILDAFEREGVVFGLEVHPAEIAYDYWTAARTLGAVRHHAFGINFDPSHLHWQQVDPVAFLEGHADRIVHVHMKDAARRLDGRNGIVASHLPFGDGRRGWDFRSVGRGDVRWEELLRALNRIGYSGPLSIEWEDVGIDREVAAPESLRFVRALAAAQSERRFDAAFSTGS